MATKLSPIHDITTFTLLDFPDHTACILWFAGCTMRCPYCHNPDIVYGKNNLDIDKVFAFLEKRKSLLDGVSLSGGESTTYPDLIPLIRRIKDMGFKVKIDTNGTKPNVIKQLIDEKLVDYIALDYKATKPKFPDVTGSNKFSKFSETLDMLCNQSDIKFEIRTTVHSKLINEQDLQEIINDLASRNCTSEYYIQNYSHKENLGNIGDQDRIVDLNKLNIPTSIKVNYRNFKENMLPK